MVTRWQQWMPFWPLMLMAGDVIKKIDVNRKILITTLIYVLLPDFFNRFPRPTPLSDSPCIGTCRMTIPTSLEGWAASPPWSLCFWQLLVCNGCYRDVMKPSYVNIPFLNGVTSCPTLACTIPNADSGGGGDERGELFWATTAAAATTPAKSKNVYYTPLQRRWIN